MEKLENKLRLRHKTVEGLVSRLNELSRAHTAADTSAVEAAKADLQARLDAAEHVKDAAEAQAREATLNGGFILYDQAPTVCF